MAGSGRTTLGDDPYEIPIKTPGTWGMNDPSEPGHAFGVCTIWDGAAPLGTIHGNEKPIVDPNFEQIPTDIDVVHKHIFPEIETPWVVAEIEVSIGAELKDPDDAKQKITIDIKKHTAEYEREIGKINDAVTIKIKGSGDGPKLVDGFIQTILNNDPKYILNGLGFEISAEVETGGKTVEHIGASLAYERKFVHINFDGKFPDLTYTGVMKNFHCPYTCTVKLGPGKEMYKELLKRAAADVSGFGKKFVQFIKEYCCEMLPELLVMLKNLVAAGIIVLTAIQIAELIALLAGAIVLAPVGL